MKNLKSNIQESLELKEVFVKNSSQRIFISKVGDVYSSTNKNGFNKLYPASNQKGYKFITITNQEKRSAKMQANGSYYIHRLVVAAFIYNGEYEMLKGLDVDHLNNKKSDNYLDNLELVSHQENCRRAVNRRKLANEVK